jgi:hypothetical protein
MYNTIITPYITHLNNLKAILTKAIAWQAENKITDEAIMGARLALDMFPLASQVRIATNFARNSGATLCGLENPVYEDTEKTLTELQARIDKVISYLQGLTEDMVKTDLETRIVALPWMPGKGLVAKYYLESYAHSNFYFHYTTAYAILRHYGLAVGKGDYMGNLMGNMKDIA